MSSVIPAQPILLLATVLVGVSAVHGLHKGQFLRQALMDRDFDELTEEPWKDVVDSDWIRTRLKRPETPLPPPESDSRDDEHADSHAENTNGKIG